MGVGLNRVILLGNLGADPELRYSAAGLPVLNLRLATNESYLDRNREVQQRTEWHNVVMFGSRGEALARILTKGLSLLVEGGLRTTSYEKEGVKRYKTEVLAKEICFPGRRFGGAQAEEGASSRPPSGDEPAGEAAIDVVDPTELDPGLPSPIPLPQPPPPPPPRNSRAAASGRIFVDELPF